MTFRQDPGSNVSFENDQFQANLDVKQFQPEEIMVKICGSNVVTVDGKHEEKQDEHGFISRHFTRRYVIPKHYDMDKVESKLSSTGILTITAPKIDESSVEYRNIQIIQTETEKHTTRTEWNN